MEEESKVSSEYKEVLDLIHFKTLFDNLNQAIVAFQDSPTPLARKINITQFVAVNKRFKESVMEFLEISADIDIKEQYRIGEYMLLFEDKSQEWKKSWDSETKRLYNSLRIKDSFYDETDRSLETLELDINSNLHDSYDTRIRNLQGTAFALARDIRIQTAEVESWDSLELNCGLNAVDKDARIYRKSILRELREHKRKACCLIF